MEGSSLFIGSAIMKPGDYGTHARSTEIPRVEGIKIFCGFHCSQLSINKFTESLREGGDRRSDFSAEEPCGLKAAVYLAWSWEQAY